MQTFLPYPKLIATAHVLDRQRLGKQRVETKQILLALENGGGWKNHPAVLMWRSHEQFLALYGVVICNEWISRGYRDTLRPQFLSRVFTLTPDPPPWFGDPKFHSSHRARLLAKNPEHYGQFGWTEQPADSVYWPVTKENSCQT